MRELNLALTGLDRNYMQKLALYASNRMKEKIRVQIYDEALPPGIKKELAAGKLLLGGPAEALSEYMADDRLHRSLILFEDEPGKPGGNRVCGWQPADRVFQEILKVWQSGQKVLDPEYEGEPAEWHVILSDGSLGQTLPYGLALAAQLGETGRCLFLDMSGHLGWRKLFELESGPDLSDLILELRQDRECVLNDYVRELAGVDLILPPQNPMVYPELTSDDLQMLLTLVNQSGLYTQAAVLAGPMLPVLPDLCAQARSMLCVYLKDGAGNCVRDEWYDFFRKAGNRTENWRELAVPPERLPDCSGRGSHVAEEWIHGLPGRQIQEIAFKG